MKKIYIPLLWQIIILLLLLVISSNAEIQGVNGIAVKKDSITWNSVQDGYVGDNLTSGVIASGTYFSDGAGNFSRVRGSIANGLQVDVTRLQGTVNASISGSINVTTISAVNATIIGTANVITISAVNATMMGTANVTTLSAVNATIIGTANVTSSAAGSNMYAIKVTNLSAATNFPFGFTSIKIMVQAPSSNTEDICINWLNKTVVCPATNTSGDDRLAPGTSISLDNFAVIGISAAANSGTQTLFIRSFK